MTQIIKTEHVSIELNDNGSINIIKLSTGEIKQFKDGKYNAGGHPFYDTENLNKLWAFRRALTAAIEWEKEGIDDKN
jgi:hypothetical protein